MVMSDLKKGSKVMVAPGTMFRSFEGEVGEIMVIREDKRPVKTPPEKKLLYIVRFNHRHSIPCYANELQLIEEGDNA